MNYPFKTGVLAGTECIIHLWLSNTLKAAQDRVKLKMKYTPICTCDRTQLADFFCINKATVIKITGTLVLTNKTTFVNLFLSF